MNYNRSSRSSSSLKKFSISDREVLNKRVQSNPRYAKVKPKTNSGFNAKRKEEIEKEIRKYYKVKNDEVFQRISLGDLLQLMLAYIEESKEEPEEERTSCPQTLLNDEPLPNPPKSPKKGGFFNLVMDEEESFPSKCDNDKCAPFLLLDVRAPTDYTSCHLATAVCYPHFKMSRAVGWESSEMLTYKNHSDWIIIVYDECENFAPEVAATLIHRGYSNVFMLSGGLRLAKDKMGPPLVTNDTSNHISDELAVFIAERILFINLPPLLLNEAHDWWAENNCPPSGAPEPVSSERDGKALSRNQAHSEVNSKKPWR